jgi:hypothetical protein
MNSRIGDWPLTEILCWGALISIAAWFAGFALNIFGGLLDQLGAVLCVFAMYVGFPVILSAMIIVTTPVAEYTSTRLRRITFYLGLLTSVSIVYHGFCGGRLL